MPPVSRAARIVDVIALVLIAGGGAIFVTALGQFREVAKLSYRHPGPPNQSALAAADQARYLAYGSVVMVLLGCVVAVLGAIRVARAKRRA